MTDSTAQGSLRARFRNIKNGIAAFRKSIRQDDLAGKFVTKLIDLSLIQLVGKGEANHQSALFNHSEAFASAVKAMVTKIRNMPLISVIIPTCHRNDLLAECLDSLAPGKQTLAAENYEVIVTDDGSTSNAQALVENKYPWAKWLKGPKRGPAANRNNGAKQSQGEWLVLTDDDCQPDPIWLESYADAISQNPLVFVFEGRTYVDRPKKRLLEEAPINEHGKCLWSCNMAISKKLFSELDGFDEDFPFATMEDKDLAYRIKKIGIDSIFLPRAAVLHPWRLNMDYSKKFRQHVASLLLYVEKHPEESSLTSPWKTLMLYIKVTLKNLPHDLRRYRWETIRFMPEFWRCAIWHLWVLFQQRTADELLKQNVRVFK